MKWGKLYYYLWYKSKMNFLFIINLCLILNMYDVYLMYIFRLIYLCIIYLVNRYFKICYIYCESS